MASHGNADSAHSACVTRLRYQLPVQSECSSAKAGQRTMQEGAPLRTAFAEATTIRPAEPWRAVFHASDSAETTLRRESFSTRQRTGNFGSHQPSTNRLSAASTTRCRRRRRKRPIERSLAAVLPSAAGTAGGDEHSRCRESRQRNPGCPRLTSVVRQRLQRRPFIIALVATGLTPAGR